jgi:hypothetical protein
MVTDVAHSPKINGTSVERANCALSGFFWNGDSPLESVRWILKLPTIFVDVISVQVATIRQQSGNASTESLSSAEPFGLEAGMGTKVEWSHVALFVAAIAVGIVCLELFVELVGVKNNPRESLVYLRHGVLLSLLFGMIQVFS